MPRAVRGFLVLVGRVLYSIGLHRVVIWLNRRAPKVLLYHRCEVAETDFTQGLGGNITPTVFAGHLDYLSRHYRIVSVSELMRYGCPLGVAAITFDDGYRSVYRSAYPELLERNLPATVYLVTDVIDNRKMVWVNELNWLLRQAGPELRTEAAMHFGLDVEEATEAVIATVVDAYDPFAIQALLERGRALAGIIDPPRWCKEQGLYLTEEEIREMAEHRISFGNHTASHPSLPQISPTEQRDEVTQARDQLARYPNVLESFAHPFGDVDGSTRRMLSQVGYHSVMEVGGWNTPWNPTRVARIPMSAATSPGELFAEMELVAPLKGWGRRVLRRETYF